MSRYALLVKKDKKIYSVAYGYDRPLLEYFIQVFDTSIADEDSSCILWKGSYMSNLSNSKMLELFEQWNVPEEHLQMVALDLPF